MENIALVTIKVPTYAPASDSAATSSSNNSSKRNSSQSKMLVMPPVPTNTFARCDQPPSGNSSLGVKVLSAGTAACIADLATFPLDTAKVRLQIQGESLVGPVAVRAGTSYLKAAVPKYRGPWGTIATVSREEGVRALYNGLTPGLQRQMCFASVRIGMYDTVKQGYSDLLKVDPNRKNVGLRILAGITTGGAAVLVAQPTDVVKVRMQAQSKKNKRYTTTIGAYRKIAIEEGTRGLWKGTLPNISRNAIVNCTELVSYDLIKDSLLRHRLLDDRTPCHFVSAVGAGFFTTLFASPVDVVKTRFMNSSANAYTGVLQCASTMYKEGGARAFYKGAVPAFLRFGTWNVVMFISFEQLKRFFSQLGNHENKLKSQIPAIEIKSSSTKYM